MKIFVTGSAGYVGSIMTDMLIEKKFEVLGNDVSFFPQDFTEIKNASIETISKDVRDLNETDISDCDAIIHLAGLSNDPLGQLNPSLTDDINFKSTVHLAKISKKLGIQKFIFSSSCSTYGVNEDIVTETSALSPLTAYAKSKVDSESELLKLRDENFCPVILRNATVFGVSPSQRLDIVVNNLTASAYATGKVKLLSDGTSWRPLIHVKDMCNAFIQCLFADEKTVSGEIFNVGSNDQNYLVRDIAKLIEKIVPNSEISFSDKANKDSRSYQVNFDKIYEKLGFKTQFDLNYGINELYQTFKEKKFNENDFKDKRFYRMNFIEWLLEQRLVNNELRKII